MARAQERVESVVVLFADLLVVALADAGLTYDLVVQPVLNRSMSKHFIRYKKDNSSRNNLFSNAAHY